MSTEGKVAIVTGATEGIGLATAELLVAGGARVVLVARRAHRGDEVAKRLGTDFATFLSADLGEPDTGRRAVDHAIKRFGRLDALVNNAAVDYVRAIDEVRVEELQRVLAVNLAGAFMMLQAAARAMHKSGGAIVNVSSRLAIAGSPQMSVYSAAKGGLEALTRAAAVELAGHGIRVNAVAPGLTATPLVDAWVAEQAEPERFRTELEESIPLRTLARPRDVADAIRFLVSDEAAHVTGAVLRVDGGYTAK